MKPLMFLSELTLRATLLFVMGAVSARIVRNRGAETEHAIWRMVLGGVLILPLLMPTLPSLPLLPARAVAAMPLVTPIFATRSPEPVPAATPAAMVVATQQYSLLPSWPGVVLGIYAAVALLLLARTAVAVRRAGKIASKAERVLRGWMDTGYPSPELRETPDVAVPFTIGLREPIIVLPKGWRVWDAFKLRSVLFHEMAHIRRADWATSCAAAILRALLWFHPMTWWLERRLAALSEEACDASAIRSTGDGPRYARVVLEFAGLVSSRQMLVGKSMTHTSRIGKRLDGILESRIPCRAVSACSTAVMLIVSLPAIYGAAALRLSAEPPLPRLKQESGIVYSAGWKRETHQELLNKGFHVTPDEAAKLEAQLAADPDNLDVRALLLSYYTQQMIRSPRDAHLLWLIAHHPEADIFRLGSELTSLSPGYPALNTLAQQEQARTLWLQQAERFPRDTRVLANAALALKGVDGRSSVNLLRRARSVEPNNPEWVDWLAAVYERAVCTSLAAPDHIGVLTGNGLGVTPFTLPLPESSELKDELETSKDVALVGETGEALIHETSRLLGPPATAEVRASAEFGKHLLARAHALDPKNPRWQR
jgi:beta-lactamase regulating signal transducer with metallopeptidase domain